LTLARGGHLALAVTNAVGPVIVGLAAVWLGFTAASWRP
jgi:fluoride ion exporter CrcB/FEX